MSEKVGNIWNTIGSLERRNAWFEYRCTALTWWHLKVDHVRTRISRAGGYITSWKLILWLLTHSWKLILWLLTHSKYRFSRTQLTLQFRGEGCNSCVPQKSRNIRVTSPSAGAQFILSIIKLLGFPALKVSGEDLLSILLLFLLLLLLLATEPSWADLVL
jgi:hypothetical protein